VPKGLARRALLLALRVIDAVRGLGNELQSRLGDLSPADDASTIFATLQAPQGLVDEIDASLEHRLPREIELARFRLARDIGRVLVGERDIAAAVALGYGEPLPDAFHGVREVTAFPLESLADRICVHLASVRQN